MIITPWGAVLVGIVGSLGSVLGIKYSLPKLRRVLRIHDTRGVFANHGIPGIVSALASVLVALLASEANYGSNLYVLYPARAPVANTTKLEQLRKFSDVSAGKNRSGGVQAAYQLACLAVTVVVAVLGGLLTGCIIRMKFFEPVNVADAFDDHDDFEEQNCIDVVSSDAEYDDGDASSAKHHDVVRHGKRRCMTDASVAMSNHDDGIAGGQSVHSIVNNNSTHCLLNKNSTTTSNFSNVPAIRVTDEVEMSAMVGGEKLTSDTSNERQALLLEEENGAEVCLDERGLGPTLSEVDAHEQQTHEPIQSRDPV